MWPIHVYLYHYNPRHSHVSNNKTNICFHRCWSLLQTIVQKGKRNDNEGNANNDNNNAGNANNDNNNAGNNNELESSCHVISLSINVLTCSTYMEKILTFQSQLTIKIHIVSKSLLYFYQIKITLHCIHLPQHKLKVA